MYQHGKKWQAINKKAYQKYPITLKLTSACIDGPTPQGQYQLKSGTIVDLIIMQAVIILQFYGLPNQMLMGDGNSCI